MPTSELSVVLSLVDDAAIQQAIQKILEPLQPQETEAERIGNLLNFFREQSDLRNLIAEATMKADDELPSIDLETALKKLRLESLVKKEAELKERIAKAEKESDLQASDALLLELTEVRRLRAQMSGASRDQY